MSESKAAIYVGCKTSHGGVVKTGSPGIHDNGIPVARVGDLVSCPEHGDNPILADVSSIKIDGVYVALDGWKTSCGSVLINKDTSYKKDGIEVCEGGTMEVITSANPESPDFVVVTEKPKFDQRIYIRGPDGFAVVGQKYKLKYGETETDILETGSHGETIVINADYPHNLKIHFLRTENLPPPQGSLDKPLEDVNEEVEVIPLNFDEKGNPFAETYISQDFVKIRHVVRLPPCTVIPVIFVPGIMGTNLKVKNNNTEDNKKVKDVPAWQPPNSIGAGIGDAFESLCITTPADRQKLLNPENTEVYTPPDFKKHDATLAYDTRVDVVKKEIKRRGWGEPHWDSYGGILQFLEIFLNSRNNLTSNNNENNSSKNENIIKSEWQAILDKLNNEQKKECGLFNFKDWNLENIIHNLSEENASKNGEYYFPVHAVGYNWLESNGKSAERLNEKVDEFIEHYEKHPYFKPLTNESKVILISHSMGGYVTRAYAKNHKNKIIGVIHGVQPVNGAPVVYRRMRDGTEVEDFTSGSTPIVSGFTHIGHLLIAGGTSEVLGSSSASITPVMANSSGCLELLPNKKYNFGKPWLKICHIDPNSPNLSTKFGFQDPYDYSNKQMNTCFSLPEKGDPYSEIYGVSVQDKWWGMIDKTAINPAKKKNISLASYNTNLKKAKKFHEFLGDYYHPNTHAHYGDFQEQPGYDEVIWLSYDKLPQRYSYKNLKDSNLGMSFKLEHRHPDDNGNGWGDSTVPNLSAKGCHEHVQVEIPFRSGKNEPNKESFDHQKSYDHKGVRLTVLWSITNFVKALS